MRRTDWIMLWTLSLLWGGSFLFVELALTGLPPLSLVWGRVALAAAVLWAVLPVTGAPGPPRAVWPALLVMGFLNNAVPFTLFALAQGQITGALASVLNAVTPLFTVLVAHPATADERLTPLKALGVLLGFAGVTVICRAKALGVRFRRCWPAFVPRCPMPWPASGAAGSAGPGWYPWRRLAGR